MSLYNMLFGKNPFSGMLLQMLGITESDVPRFRDCYTNEDGSEIVIHTRTGGGNRADYGGSNDALTRLPGFKFDQDDDFDCTYADFHYEVPEPFREQIMLLKDMGAVGNPGERWRELLTKLREKDTSDPEVKRALAVGEAILGRINTALESGQSGTIIKV